MRRSLVGGVCILAAFAGALAPAASAAKKPAPKKLLSPHLCAWLTAAGAGGSLGLEGSCEETRSRPKTIHTPLGSYIARVYSAKWGKPSLELVPRHFLGVAVAHVTGSSPVVSYIQKRERAKVLENGVPVANSKGVLATWAGDTHSCKNPPTGDCTLNEFESTKGNWGVVLIATGAPPTEPGAEEKDESNGDDAEDLAQEEMLMPATVGVGMAITGKL